MSAPDPVVELVEALRRALTTAAAAAPPCNHFRVRRDLSFASRDRQSRGHPGTLLWLGGGLQWIPAIVFTGPGDAASPVP
ncbi:hypothetical protein QTP86_011698 [Hemibagrus guttatus]|nr:hypothetical protein QTP86_011698 [Hemibagrus guttatus]